MSSQHSHQTADAAVPTEAQHAVEVSLPGHGHHQATFSMLWSGQLDQVGHAMGAVGWSGFEPPMPDVFLACAKRYPGRIIDIGANTGLYSLIAACAHADNRVIAFEPDPAVLGVLRENLRINRFGTRVQLEPIALSDSAGEADLYIPVQDHGCVETSSSLNADFKGVHSGVVKVPVNTLDRYLQAPAGWRERVAELFGRPSRRPVTLMKIDVEGHEQPAVAGSLGTIRTHRPLVFVELLPRADFAYFQHLIGDLGYIDLRLRPAETVESATVGFDEHAWNHLLAPAERRGELQAMLENLGLPLRADG